VTIFTVIVVSIFVTAAVAGGRACDHFTSDMSPALRIFADALSAVCSGAIAVKVYFVVVDALISRRSKNRRADED